MAKKEKKRAEYGHIDAGGEIKRLHRVVGQIEGVCKMLKGQRRLDEVLSQCKAIRSAISSVEQRIIQAHLEVALDEIPKLDKKKNKAQKIAELGDLFRKAC